jgi:hypothetical protein
MGVRIAEEVVVGAWAQGKDEIDPALVTKQ